MENGTAQGIYIEILTTAYSRMKGYQTETKSTAQNIKMLGLERTDCYINDRLSILSE